MSLNIPNRITVDVPEEQRDRLLLDALWILKNVREKKILWEHHYGAQYRDRLRVWENKADRLLSDLKLIDHAPELD